MIKSSNRSNVKRFVGFKDQCTVSSVLLRHYSPQSSHRSFDFIQVVRREFVSKIDPRVDTGYWTLEAPAFLPTRAIPILGILQEIVSEPNLLSAGFAEVTSPGGLTRAAKSGRLSGRYRDRKRAAIWDRKKQEIVGDRVNYLSLSSSMYANVRFHPFTKASRKGFPFFRKDRAWELIIRGERATVWDERKG